jgi:hypothetical protein
VSHPVGLPDLFVDRSLGRIRVPTLLRAAGLRLVTLAERYGIPKDETVQDTEWLADAGRSGEAVFMKDDRVRYNRAEKDAVIQHRVRCFCLARQDLPAQTMAQMFLDHLPAITAACASEGPFIYVVRSTSIRKVDL